MIKSIKFPIIVYTFWQIVTLLFQIFLQPLYKISDKTIFLEQRLFLTWMTNWDSSHYIDIAIKGYQFPQQAFFPLWPLLIKSFSWVGEVRIMSFGLTLFFSLSTFILFFLLAEKLIGRSNAKYALVLFASFPSTMFLHAAYTEGLFLSLTLLSFLLIEKQKYLYASVLAGFASATRVIGFAISFSFLVLKTSIKFKILLFLVSLSGLLGYMLFLQINYNDPLYFAEAQKNWCQNNGRCKLVFPLDPVIAYTKLVLIGWVKPALSSVFLDWFFTVIFLGFLYPVYKKLGGRYFIYTAIVLLVPLSSGSISAMIRYVLTAFPVFFVFPLILRSKIAFILISIVLFLLQLRFVALFTNSHWVA